MENDCTYPNIVEFRCCRLSLTSACTSVNDALPSPIMKVITEKCAICNFINWVITQQRWKAMRMIYSQKLSENVNNSIRDNMKGKKLVIQVLKYWTNNDVYGRCLLNVDKNTSKYLRSKNIYFVWHNESFLCMFNNTIN